MISEGLTKMIDGMSHLPAFNRSLVDAILTRETSEYRRTLKLIKYKLDLVKAMTSTCDSILAERYPIITGRKE